IGADKSQAKVNSRNILIIVRDNRLLERVAGQGQASGQIFGSADVAQQTLLIGGAILVVGVRLPSALKIAEGCFIISLKYFLPSNSNVPTRLHACAAAEKKN